VGDDRDGFSALPKSILAARAVLTVKAVLGLWAAYALLTASRAHHRTFLGATIKSRHSGTGDILLVLAVVTVVAVLALARPRRWARTMTLILEGASVTAALSVIRSRTAPALVALALSVVVVGLLVSPASDAAFSGRRQG
jgi:hypothetical protein